MRFILGFLVGLLTGMLLILGPVVAIVAVVLMGGQSSDEQPTTKETPS